MYTPPFNEERRLPVLHEHMRAHPLATLVTLTPGGLAATHLPLLLDHEGSEWGVLRGHISRANHQGKESVPAVDALAVFSGAQHYISPNWYATKQEHGMVVPTWNYVTVHAYGPLRIVEDAAWLHGHLKALTDVHEASSSDPWKVSDAPEEFVAGQARGILGIELPIRLLEGKWKVSQNRSEADRAGVASALGELGSPASLAMKAQVERR